ncbi:MAG: ATP-binding protein [Usitatibacter sp.]
MPRDKGRAPDGARTELEISALIESLHRTGERLEVLTGGEVDAVADASGQSFMLRRGQVQMRAHEAEKQAGILDALPANVALIDTRGLIVSVNQAWREFGAANHLQAGYPVGADYLAVCDAARGADSELAAEAASGIRAVLAGDEATFAIEYPCHSPTQMRWFLMKATPLGSGNSGGAVLMHVDVSKQRLATEELVRTHAHLVQASRQAGMAEVATNILHNVGNVLNSINVSATVALDAARGSSAEKMGIVVALMREHEGGLGEYLASDAQGRHILAMLEQLARDWLAQQQALEVELVSLRGNVDHVKRIVAMQQGYAKAAGEAEMVDLRELVEESLRMNSANLTGSHLDIERRFAEIAPFSVEKHKVLQILVNLVRNAQHACASSGRLGCSITVAIAESDGRIRISVTDTGAGIAAENLVRIFAHGFTTRKDGHGFGLHSGALAALELGGALTAQSAGPGLGATFTLELPALREHGDA